jgi:hypothetical protein
VPKKALASAVVALPLSLAAAPALADAPPRIGVVSKDPGRASVELRQGARVAGSTRRAGYGPYRRHHGYVGSWDGRYRTYSRRHYFIDGVPSPNPFGSGVSVLHGVWPYYTPGPEVAWYPYSHGDSVVPIYPPPIYRPVCPCY